MNVTAVAVIIDSAVTVAVGFRLNRTAKKEVKKAVNEIQPAIRQSVEEIAHDFQQETKEQIVHAIEKMIPLIIKLMKKQNARD